MVNKDIWRQKRCRFNPWVRRILWRRAQKSTLVFLPGESYGQRSLVGYSPEGLKESDMTEVIIQHTHHSKIHLPIVFRNWIGIMSLL